MAINFKKLKEQIKPFKEGGKRGYMFVATQEQEERELFAVKALYSKRHFMEFMTWLVYYDNEWRKEFAL